MKIELNCVKHKFCIKKIIINSFFLLLSIGIIVLTSRLITDDTSAEYMACMSVGVMGVLLFAIKAIFKTKKIVYAPTGSEIEHVTTNFTLPNNDISTLEDALNRCNIDILTKWKSDNKSDTLVEIIYTKDGNFGAYQISKYVPYQFEVVRDWTIVNNYPVKEMEKIIK